MRSSTVMRVAASWFVGVLLCVTLSAGQPSLDAQSQVGSGWEIIQTCAEGLTYPVLPRSQWDFEGVIFSENQDGIRAIRTDVDTSYFIAHNTHEPFSSVGAFSPDGKWFAYPVWASNLEANTGGMYFFTVEAIEVVSTDPARTVSRFPWHDFGSLGLPPDSGVSGVMWLDNERLFYPGGYIPYPFPEISGFGIVNLTNNQIEPWEPSELPHHLLSLSTDATRGFSFPAHDSEWRTSLIDLRTGDILLTFPINRLYRREWRNDSTAFYALDYYAGAPPGYQLVAVDRDGNPLDVLYSGEDDPYNLSVSPQDDYLAFTAGNRLFIADLANRQIHDLCFTFGYWMGPDAIVWSPDGHELAFTYDGYPVLLSLDTLEMEVLDYPTGRLVGWYSIE